MLSLAVLVAGCTSLIGETPADPAPENTETDDASTDTPAASDCVRFTGDHSTHIDTGALASDALFLSGETFLCAPDVVVVGEANLNEVAAAAQLAAAMSGPLLFPEPRLSAELGRLKPERVHIIGSLQVNVPGDAESLIHDIASAVDLAQQRLDATDSASSPAVPDASTIVDTVLAIEDGGRVVLPETGAESASTTVSASPEIAVGEVVVGLTRPSDASAFWMVDAASPATVLLASAVGNAIGASVLALDGSDVLAYPEVGTAIAAQDAETVRYVGAVPEASPWELAVLTNGQQVPGGGFDVLPAEQQRRFVAYYGHPGTPSLGVLGEQGPAETRAKMQDFVDVYAGDGSQVIPTFEIIATVASAGPGNDGDYSTEWPAETFDEWIAYARDNDMYLILDLQSGREPFLGQAMLYEELLMLPFVGLALDPEWRLTDGQVHLEQTGTVDAVEINETVNWVADLVRDNGIPQKMMIVHQFKTSMITNRDQIVLRPEIQMVIQMDGDGTEVQKNSTWSILHQGPDSTQWAWGWKNFFDEDEPGPPPPESTMGKVPSPIFVSYQ